MFGLFNKRKLPQPPSPGRQQFDDTITLLLCGLDDNDRDRARTLVDLDGFLADCEEGGDSPVEAAFHATRLILDTVIDRMPDGQREAHRKALEAKDASDPFCKALGALAQVAEQLESQRRVKPLLVRMLTLTPVFRLRGLSAEEAHSAWCEHEVVRLLNQPMPSTKGPED